MPCPTRRAVLATLVLATAALPPRRAGAQEGPAVSLFRVVGPRDEVLIGLTTPELDGMGTGLPVERIARALVGQGQLTAWQYVVGRAPDGSTRLATSHKISILRHDALRIEPYAPALPVVPPPGS